MKVKTEKKRKEILLKKRDQDDKNYNKNKHPTKQSTNRSNNLHSQSPDAFLFCLSVII